MPNWVETKVYAIKDDADFNKFVGEDGDFTFEKVIPSPGPDYKDWYNWNCEHWGTTWDAYDPDIIDKGSLRFKTAWTFALPVMRELAKKVGGIICFYADEDIGSNCGGVIIRGDRPERVLDGDTIFANIMWGMDIESRESVLFEFDYYLEG